MRREELLSDIATPETGGPASGVMLSRDSAMASIATQR